ncbi:MAG: integrin alpha [Planctomycetes bacterium]|nr:integrin alpha [Planctomycetota bacterium]
MIRALLVRSLGVALAAGNFALGAGSRSFNGNFGCCVASVGDVDADGVLDIAVGQPCARFGDVQFRSTEPMHGRVAIHRSSDGKLLLELHGEREQELFGASIVGLGDLDGDRADDFAVGSAFAREVRVYSGRSGTLLRRLRGFDEGDTSVFGLSLAAVEDLDGDGARELVVGSPLRPPRAGTDTTDDALGGAYVFSARTGALLRTFATGVEGVELGRWFGGVVASAGDVDGDGMDDIAIATSGELRLDLEGRRWSPRYADSTLRLELPQPLRATQSAVERELAGPSRAGRVSIFSGRTGTLIRQLTDEGSEGAPSGFGCALAALDDIDGDRRPELAVGADRAIGGGAVFVFSSATSRRLATLTGGPLANAFGWSLANVGDQDDDGIADLAIGDPARVDRSLDVWENRIGMVTLVSGRDFSALGALAEGHPDLNVTEFGFSIAALPVAPPRRSRIVVGALNSGLYGMAFTYGWAPGHEPGELRIELDGTLARASK